MKLINEFSLYNSLIFIDIHRYSVNETISLNIMTVIRLQYYVILCHCNVFITHLLINESMKKKD